jgi:hypothetical protein
LAFGDIEADGIERNDPTKPQCHVPYGQEWEPVIIHLDASFPRAGCEPLNGPCF